MFVSAYFRLNGAIRCLGGGELRLTSGGNVLVLVEGGAAARSEKQAGDLPSMQRLSFLLQQN